MIGLLPLLLRPPIFQASVICQSLCPVFYVVFFFMSFSSLLPSLSPRDIKYYALTTTTLFPPNIKQYLRIR